MSKQPAVAPNPRETISLMEGISVATEDFELAYGGDYIFMARSIKGSNPGNWNGASVQLQSNLGTVAVPDWVNGPAAVSADMAAGVGLGISAGTPVRVLLTGAPTGAGLRVTLSRLPA